MAGVFQPLDLFSPLTGPASRRYGGVDGAITLAGQPAAGTGRSGTGCDGTGRDGMPTGRDADGSGTGRDGARRGRGIRYGGRRGRTMRRGKGRGRGGGEDGAVDAGRRTLPETVRVVHLQSTDLDRFVRPDPNPQTCRHHTTLPQPHSKSPSSAATADPSRDRQVRADTTCRPSPLPPPVTCRPVT